MVASPPEIRGHADFEQHAGTSGPYLRSSEIAVGYHCVGVIDCTVASNVVTLHELLWYRLAQISILLLLRSIIAILLSMLVSHSDRVAIGSGGAHLGLQDILG